MSPTSTVTRGSRDELGGQRPARQHGDALACARAASRRQQRAADQAGRAGDERASERLRVDGRRRPCRPTFARARQRFGATAAVPPAARGLRRRLALARCRPCEPRPRPRARRAAVAGRRRAVAAAAIAAAAACRRRCRAGRRAPNRRAPPRPAPSRRGRAPPRPAPSPITMRPSTIGSGRSCAGGSKPGMISFGISCLISRSMSRRKPFSSTQTSEIASPWRAGAAGAADAVHVVLGHVRQLEVDDVRQLVDVDAARGDVGRDQHLQRRRP